MTISVLFAAVISIAMLVFFASSAAASLRRRKFYELLTRTETFHCLKCDSVYTAVAGLDFQPCPKCGYKNSKLKF